MSNIRNWISFFFLLQTNSIFANSYSIINNNNNNNNNPINSDNDKNNNHTNRRKIIQNGFRFVIVGATGAGAGGTPLVANAVERAVGGNEIKCREEGNCLEKGEWDGAIGWEWGAKDRCDPADPLCTTSGKLRDVPLEGRPVPTLPEPLSSGEVDLAKITDVVQINLTIGKQKQENISIRIGLFGNGFPTLVKQFTSFASANGLLTSSPLTLQDGYGVSSAPVSLAASGILSYINPDRQLQFGVLSQGSAFAKRKGKPKVPSDFLPQPRPSLKLESDENSLVLRKHDSAGLLSVPSSGLGYSNRSTLDDEAYADAFLITCIGDLSLDEQRGGRKVIGQLLDEDSMAAIARLSNLPTRKGFAGVLPGVNAGPPLVKVSVSSTNTSKASVQ